jgi:hypothetical protein
MLLYSKEMQLHAMKLRKNMNDAVLDSILENIKDSSSGEKPLNPIFFKLSNKYDSRYRVKPSNLQALLPKGEISNQTIL